MKNILCVCICCATVIAVVTLFLSCGNDATSPSSLERWVYYPASTIHDADRKDCGLFRIGLYSGKREQITNAPVSQTTLIAKNGIIVMEFTDSIKQKLYGRCEDGRLIPVPLPEPDTTGWYYFFPTLGSMTLASEGHHLSYRVAYDALVGIPERIPYERLVYFDCNKWELTLVNPNILLSSLMPGFERYGVGVGIAFGDQQAQSLLFVATGLTKYGQTYLPASEMIVEWRGGKIIPHSSLLSVRYRQIIGYDPTSKNLLISQSDGCKLRMLDNENEINLSVTPLGIAEDRSEFIAWNQDSLALFRMSDGGSLHTIISLPSLKNMFGYSNITTGGASISHDGGWIVFMIRPIVKDPPFTYDMFVIRRDGSQLQRIASQVRCGNPVISNDMKN